MVLGMATLDLVKHSFWLQLMISLNACKSADVILLDFNQ